MCLEYIIKTEENTYGKTRLLASINMKRRKEIKIRPGGMGLSS